MSLEKFLETLDPKTAARVRTADQSPIDLLPTASYGLTRALGGGIGRGTITTTYGNPSAGKSLVWEQSIGFWQKMGLTCGWVDVEKTFDPKFASRLGIDNKELIFARSQSSGKIEEEITPWLKNNIDVLVIDSISFVLPEVFIGKDGAMNDQMDRKQLGAQAKALASLVNGIHYLNESTAVILISQTTTEIGQNYVKQIPHGGKKVLFASSQIIKLTSSSTENAQKKADIQIGDLLIEQPVGRSVEYYVEKNKLGPQSGKGTYDMYYAGKEIGIDRIGEVLDQSEKYQIVKKGGAWYNYGDLKWQGRDKTVSYFKENPEELELLEKKIHTFETGEV